MPVTVDGATRLYIIVGDPIAQVRSPGGMTQALAALGRNAVLVPIHVAPADLNGLFKAMSRVQNLDGIVVTIPHKFAAYEFCAAASERAHFIGAVNIMRRAPDGGWFGDMLDGSALPTPSGPRAASRKGCALCWSAPAARAPRLPLPWWKRACANWPSTIPTSNAATR